jgi:hypothetical protein
MHDTHQASPRQKHLRREMTGANVHRLKSVSVIGGFLDGVQLDLADGLNCVIGARGTGNGEDNRPRTGSLRD